MLRAEALALAQAVAFLKSAAERAEGMERDGVRIYDAVPMRMHRRAHLERAQLLVESRSRPALQTFLAQWVAALYDLKAPKALRWHIDVDPLEF
jgi:primosomal protein N' (replication factor Y)